MKLNLLTSVILSTSLMACTTAPLHTNLVGNTKTIHLVEQGRYHSNIFNESAAEIVTFDKKTQNTFVVNAESKKIDVIRSGDITKPILLTSLNVGADIQKHLNAEAGAANSVDVFDGLLAVAIEAKNKTDAGWVAFYDTQNLSFISAVYVGALPDMVTFTPNGKQLLVALEGEPSAKNYARDPDGEVAVIDLDWHNKKLTTILTRLGFYEFNEGGVRSNELPEQLVLNGFQASVEQDLEPEYIAVNKNSTKAYVSLQENNAIAVINLADKQIEKIMALGFKDHLQTGNELDGNSKDKKALLKNEPALGMYQPDSIAVVTLGGTDYLLTANEGDDRSDWLSELAQAECEAGNYYYNLQDKDCGDDITLQEALDSGVYNPSNKQSRLDLSNFEKGGVYQGAVKTLKFSHSASKQFGDLNDDGKMERILTFGGRSFSIWNVDTEQLVFDSGSDFERITAQKYGANYNQSHSKTKAEDRSGKKGPEPEALTTAVIEGKIYALIGLERMGGIMVYDISNPAKAQFVQYLNNRELSVNPNDNVEKNGEGVNTYRIDAGDLGPEGFRFVAAKDSPTNSPILIVGNEVSGTTSFYRIDLIER
ncbi:MAG: DNA-binding beta-propeller fold protein YncE [Psychromonas sp.]|jgi:DNA-binding beta-propeller fold protein YncE|uniref:choice-of-anchor I family protein n=1 Tax=Psychromonas sp. TaxID=1884585 RepID=UPI0039E459FF